MTILNDKEIRALSIVPTHMGNEIFGSREHYAKSGDLLYSMNSGLSYHFEPMQKHVQSISSEELAKFSRRMISPFRENLKEVGVISYGLSSFGYDATLSPRLKIAKQKNVEGLIFDPKNVNPDIFEDIEGDELIIPPHGFALGHTVEIFDIPDDVLAICMAKSTFARGGLIVGVTPLEPGWRGSVTLEFSNTLDIPVKLYAHEGIVQFLFYRGTSAPDVTYSQRGGKYMDQRGIVLSRILQA